MIVVEVQLREGQMVRMEIEQFVFVRKCPHCDTEFSTTDPRKVYPNDSHASMDRRYRRILRELHN